MTPQTPTEGDAPGCKASLFVTGSWPPDDHPAYGDEALVARMTDWFIEHGHTVLQTFLLDPDERLHARMVRRRIPMPSGARVLSLGSGVAGMEAYWVDERPDISVTQVNASMAQLSRSRCPGTLVLGDMRDPGSWDGSMAPFDLAVMAYSLHHVDDVPAMLAVAYACLKPGGTLLVLDVWGGSVRYHEACAYRTLDPATLAVCGLVRLDYGLGWHRQPDEVLGTLVGSMLDAGEARPGMWVGLA